MILAGAPRSVTDRLQRVLNASSRLVSGTRKYDRGLSKILHADLHWWRLGVVVSIVGRINEVNQHRARLVHDG